MKRPATRAELIAINAALCDAVVTIAGSLGTVARHFHESGDQQQAMTLYASSARIIALAKHLKAEP